MINEFVDIEGGENIKSVCIVDLLVDGCIACTLGRSDRDAKVSVRPVHGKLRRRRGRSEGSCRCVNLAQRRGACLRVEGL